MAVKAGEEIDAWCTKCRMDLTHRIVAVVALEPKRVECLTCHTQHNYRAPKGSVGVVMASSASKANAKKATGKRMTKAQAQLIADWEGRVLNQASSAFTNYNISVQFSPEQLVRHKKFGEGYVAEVLSDGKVTIVFRDGPKTLVHSRG